MTTEETCGTGKACEKVCPVMRAGRACPGLTVFFAEIQSSSAARRSTFLENDAKSMPSSPRIANSVDAFI
jgi:hypothetical protein